MSFFLFLNSLLIWLFIELFLWALFRWLRADFQWLVMGVDKNPVMNKLGLKKFFEKGWDSELGWVRKPYTTGMEKGRNSKKTQFSINKYGARSNPGYDNQDARISLFGDSYAFSRQVDDNKTWAHMVSKRLNENILNFGVGNYGLDQALLKLKREQKNRKTELYIIMVVPETICRVQSAWKHYSEYGNVFAFKPRFVLEENGLVLIPNIINTKEKFFKYEDYLDTVKSNDYFYQTKFLKDILTFPFLYTFLRSLKRNGPLVFSLLRTKFFKDQGLVSLPFQKIIRNNHLISMSLYRNKDSLKLMLALVAECKKITNNSKFLFCMTPQLQDIELLKKNGVYYDNFLKEASKITPVLDLTDVLIAQDDIGKCYVNDIYGGHLSDYGNKVIAQNISEKIDNMFTHKRFQK